MLHFEHPLARQRRRAKSAARIPTPVALFCLATLLPISGFAAPVSFPLTATFRDATAADWTFSGSLHTAALTAPSPDAAGSGWLRLTDNNNGWQAGQAWINSTITPSQSLVVDFDYVIWDRGGDNPASPWAADGMTFFLKDASLGMNGPQLFGGAQGYCNSAGGYLGLSFDVSGVFSSGAGTTCTGGATGGSNSIMLRGPANLNSPGVANVAPAGTLSNPTATTRPAVTRSAKVALYPFGLGRL